MDPIAHTLVGASLAETGLRRGTRLATPALVIGANLPDVDTVASFIDADTMYGFRRGWTHGVLAMAILPVLLAGLLLLYARLRPGDGRGPPLRPGALLGLCYVGVLSHPFLDWLNNYGVRLLMPLSDSWYYGDALFIVDPWMWLSMASAVVLARSSRRLALSAWALLALLTSAVVLGTGLAPWPAQALWVLCVLAIAVARARVGIGRAPQLARIALSGLALYIAANLALSVATRAHVRAWLTAQGAPPARVYAGPVAANPFQRDVVALVGAEYRFLLVDWLQAGRVRATQAPLPLGDGPLPRKALAAPELAGYAHWLRLPAFRVEQRGELTRVWIADVRYSRAGASIGNAWVDFDASGRKVATWISR